MSRLLICVSALLGFVFSVQAQTNDDPLPVGAIARLGEVRYRHVGRVLSIAFAPDGKTLLAGAWDGSIRLWDVTTGKELCQYPGHKGWVRSVAFTPDGKTFASGGKDRIIRLWETATGKELRRFEGHQHGVASLAFSPDGKLLASRYRTLRLWDVATGRQVRLINPPLGVISFAFSPDGKLLAYGSVNSLVLLDLVANKEMRRLTLPQSAFGSLTFAADSKTLTVVNNWNHTVYSWDIAPGKQLRPLNKRERFLSGIVYSPDDRSMALTKSDHAIHIQEVCTRRDRYQFSSPDKNPRILAYSPDGCILAQGSEDISVLLWDATGLHGKNRPRSTSLPAKELQTLWDDLASADAAIAYRAIGKLVAGSKNSVSFIREHLRPITPADVNTIAQLISDLDSEQFEMRQKATEQLRKWGDLAEPALRQALQSKMSLEKRRRIDRLLERLIVQRENPGSERLRMLRALEALEYMTTPAARQALQELAKGAPAADLTNEASAVLKRLAKLTGLQRQQSE